MRQWKRQQIRLITLSLKGMQTLEARTENELHIARRTLEPSAWQNVIRGSLHKQKGLVCGEISRKV